MTKTHRCLFSVLVSSSLLSSSLSVAMTPPGAPVYVPPRSSVMGIGSVTDEGLGVSLFARQSTRSRLRSGTRNVDNSMDEKTVNQRTVLQLDYRLTQRITAILSVPHIYTKAQVMGMSETANGLGDIAVYGKYSVYMDRLVSPTREMALLAGMDFPTGATHVKDQAGNPLPINLQPGSDTADFVVGGMVVWNLATFIPYGDVTYRISGKRAYTFGDFLAINAGINYPIPRVKSLSLVGELNGEWIGHNRSKASGMGIDPDGRVLDSGWETIYLTPGLQWRPFSLWAFHGGVQIPVYQNLRGTQLASSSNIYLGVQTRFGGTVD